MSTSRAYRSRLRTEQAEGTRRAIRQAALRLFGEGGFAGTTIAQIAAEAGVSTPTVYAVFGSKGAIVRELMDELEAAADEDGAGEAIYAEPDTRKQVAGFAKFLRRLFERGAPVFRAVREAGGDADAGSVEETGNARRLEGARGLTRIWADRGALRPGLTPDDAAEQLWLLTSAELFLLATSTPGWDGDRYEAWLRETIEALLLAPA